MIKKMKITLFNFGLIIFFIIFSPYFVLPHAGQRMQLLSELSESVVQQQLGMNSAALFVKSIATEDQFFSLVCNGQANPTVMMVGPQGQSNQKKLDAVCSKVGVDFYTVDVEKNKWILSWLSKNLSYSTQSFPLFLFFQGKELLLPLCQGSLEEQTLLQVIQKKFKRLPAMQTLALKKSDRLQSTLFPKVDFVLTATSAVKMK